MKNRWSKSAATRFVNKHADSIDKDIALRLYSSHLQGSEPSLVLHGGGNSSVKSTYNNILNQQVEAIFIKASGHDLANLTSDGLPGLHLNRLQELQALNALDDAQMVNQIRCNLFDSQAPTPSIEALLHTFLPAKYIDHSHADAILTLSNQKNGEEQLKKAFGDEVIILSYIHPGFSLAKAVVEAYKKQPDASGIILMQHGLITWGDDALTAYTHHIEIVTRAEVFIQNRINLKRTKKRVNVAAAKKQYRELAPKLRGELATPSNNPDTPYKRFILSPIIDKETLNIIAHEKGEKRVISPPLTSDHLIRCKPLPVWIADQEQITPAIANYKKSYLKYFKKQSKKKQAPYDDSPRVAYIPGVGVVCAGVNVDGANIVRDITKQTLQVKNNIAAMGEKYAGLSEADMFAMEYYPLQQAKLTKETPPSLAGSIGMVTGAAGAIGAGICRELLANGCHVAATDLPGPHLNSLVADLNKQYPGRVIAVAMDVTSPEAVKEGLGQIIDVWGGLDIAIINAGLAHVCSLNDMKTEDFNRLQRVNIEGTLNVLSATGHILNKQGTGGDIILISTKNVFAPGANFGAYSATKAAAHQLARIASLEMAANDVRVNMVSPDAVFSEGKRKSGLWAEVGPDRMKARGLDEAGLEAYYQNRNLLKSAVTAKHVANAVLYFVTRQSPTTGATIPVDGGLPDATPR
jgi:rhamnose utilization protein RhaD (predicted bifunctional aldolase and dehydrogenase)/NAD(P)-dependent dehydrogenase (short-subunit alcohol dehydrogenase family)